MSPETTSRRGGGRPDWSSRFTYTALIMRREGLRFCVSATDLSAAAERLQGSLFYATYLQLLLCFCS